jgi:SNF2 family DNA or RNA helicase
MITEPHDFQLKGAAQLYMLSHSRWRGGMLGDKMGVGKTLQAILLEQLVRQDKGGPVLIVVPASLLKQWEQAIKRQYETVRIRSSS